MRWLQIFVLVCFGLVAASSLESVNYDGYKVFKIKPKTVAEVKLLENFLHHKHFDFWTKHHSPNVPVSVMVSPKAQKMFTDFLKKHTLVYRVIVENVQEKIDEESKHQRISPRLATGNVSFTKYLRHNEINDYLNELATSYPHTVKTEVIGQSYEKRNMTLIKISSGGKSKPAIFVDAGIHAREWIAPPVALYIINQLVENPANKLLYQNVDWYIIPSLNPDGYEYTHTSSRLWRKTRSPNSLCVGTDANRNFDFHWMEEGASPCECDEIYAGYKAFSEMETQVLRNFLLHNKNTIKLYLTFHSYGQYLLYPWGYATQLPSNWRVLQSLAEEVNEAISAVDGTDYMIGSSTNVLYAAAGGSDDWAKGIAGIDLAYTIELPGGGSAGFNPPASRILPIAQETWEGVKVYQKYIEDNYA